MKVKIDLSGLEGIDREIVSTRIQEACFAMGIYWLSGSKEASKFTQKYLFIDEEIHNCSGDKGRFERQDNTQISHQDFIAKYGKPLKIQPAVIDMKNQPKEVWDQVLAICVRSGIFVNDVKVDGADTFYIKSAIGFTDDILVWENILLIVGNCKKLTAQEFISLYSPVKEPATEPKKVDDILGHVIFDTAPNKAMIEGDNRPMSEREKEWFDKQKPKEEKKVPGIVSICYMNEYLLSAVPRSQ